MNTPTAFKLLILLFMQLILGSLQQSIPGLHFFAMKSTVKSCHGVGRLLTLDVVYVGEAAAEVVGAAGGSVGRPGTGQVGGDAEDGGLPDGQLGQEGLGHGAGAGGVRHAKHVAGVLTINFQSESPTFNI